MIEFRPDDNGPLNIFELPQPGITYALGLDASTGLAQDNTGMQVLTRTFPHRQVARFKAKWEVFEVSRFADMLGRFYNNALMVVEINYPGNAVQDALVQQYRYPNNYQSEEYNDEDPSVSAKFGFRTTEDSKWRLIRETQLSLEQKGLILYDEDTLDEFLNFIYSEEKKKAQAASGFKDDLVMSGMLAHHGCVVYPQATPPKQKKQKPNQSNDPQTNRLWRIWRKNLMQGTLTEEVTII